MATNPLRPHNVHDHFVHYIYCRPEAAAIMLRRALPAELCKRLDLEALVLASPMYTDSFLRERITDLAFSTRLVDGETSTPARINIEHQSTPDALHPVRHVSYGTAFWTEEARARPHAVPPLTPVVLVTFLQHPARNTPTQLSALLDMPPALRDVVGTSIEARIHGTDFSGSVLDDPVAPRHFRALVEAACAVLHAYHNEQTLTGERLAELAPLFDIILEHFGSGDIQAFWTYITAVFENGEQICATLMQLTHPSTREAYMTVQQQWLEQGRKVGKAEAVLDVLALRELPIPVQVRQQVLAMRDDPTLLGWLARAFTVASAEELVVATEV